MELKDLRKALAKEAKAAGICKEWLEKIEHATNREALLALAVKGNDFLLLHDFPSDRLAAEFTDIAPHFGIYINRGVDAFNPRFIFARGTAAGAISYKGFGVGEVYACKGAILTITAGDYAKVYATLEPGATIQVKATGSARVTISQHGGSMVTEATDGATIKVKPA